MKILLILAACIIALTSKAQSPVEYIECDFSDGIPDDFVFMDLDGNTLSPDVLTFGFHQGDSWIKYSLPTDNNDVACSTSWYKPAGQSNDWMILPRLKVSDDDAVLYWRAKAADIQFRDGYKVVISEKTIDSGLLNVPAVLEIEQEEGKWTSHTIPLGQFKNKEISIAFVNNSFDKSRLYIDDIAAGIVDDVNLQLDVPAIIPVNKGFTLNGRYLIRSAENMTSPRIVLNIEGNEFFKDLQIDNTLEGEYIDFSWDTGYVPCNIGRHNYSVSIYDNEKLIASQEDEILVSVHNIVMEEGTGTWCGYCIRGIVAMKELEKKYTDNFIGIAIHSNDVMEINNYSIYDIMETSGLPAAVVNRSIITDPLFAKSNTVIDHCLQESPEAYIDLHSSLDNTNHISISTTTVFPKDYEDNDLRLAFIIKENNVYHPTDPAYSQKNAYSGSTESMGGFENAPNTIPSKDISHQDVARYVADSSEGIMGSLPRSIEKGVEYTYETSLELPDIIDNIAETDLIVLVIDNDAKKILNAADLKLSNVCGITKNILEDEIINVQYCDLAGRPCNGNNVCSHIKISTYSSGKVKAEKIINKTDHDDPFLNRH